MHVKIKIKELEKADSRISKIKELIQDIENELNELRSDCSKAEIEFASENDTEAE